MVNRENYPRRVSLNLTEEQYEALTDECEKNNLTMSEFLRTAIENAPYIFMQSDFKVPKNVLFNITSEIEKFKKNISREIAAYIGEK